MSDTGDTITPGFTDVHLSSNDFGGVKAKFNIVSPGPDIKWADVFNSPDPVLSGHGRISHVEVSCETAYPGATVDIDVRGNPPADVTAKDIVSHTLSGVRQAINREPHGKSYLGFAQRLADLEKQPLPSMPTERRSAAPTAAPKPP